MTDATRRPGRVPRRFVPVAMGLLALLGLLGLRLALPDPFVRLRLAVFDDLQRLRPWTPAASPVRVVDIDDESLARIGQWPWSRSVVARMVRRLQDAGAAVIAFDIVFAEKDRTSPAALARTWAAEFGWAAPAVGGTPLPDYDADLATTFGRGRVVSGFGLVGQRNAALPALSASFATIGGDPAATVRGFHGAVPNLPALDAAAAGQGTFSVVGEYDQVIRRLPVLLAVEGRLVPSLALEALRVAADEDTIRVRTERTGGTVTGYTVRVGDTEVGLDRDGMVDLHHAPAHSRATIPAWRLLAPDAALDAELKGRIVLVGTGAVGLSDLRATPVNPLEPGVNLHARAIEQMLAPHALSRPPWAAGAELVAAGATGLLAVLLTGLCSLRLAVPAAVALAALAGLGSFAAFAGPGLLLDPSLVLAATAVGTAATGLTRYFVAERDAARLRGAFTHYLSPDLVDVLARDPDRLKLGGELRELTFLFTDLEGFTSLMEAADPEEAVGLLNAYLDGICRVAIDHGGTVDKIVGDALHVMFNAPLDQPDHPARAVRCALAIDAFAQAFAAARHARGLPFGVTRIGVNTGPAVVGNFGGSRRFDYTAHGDAINTAARLESANKALGTRLCVARSTAEAVTDIDFMPVGTLMLKGKSRGVDVFLPLAAGSPAWTADYRDAFALLERGETAGGDRVLALHDQAPDDPLLRLHARRVRAGERDVRMVA